MTDEAERPGVTIAGATGHLGQHVTTALLQHIRHYSQVVLLTRPSSKPNPLLKKWQGIGAVVREYNEDNLAAALEGVDVLISTVGPSGHAFKKKLLQALPQTNISVYIPSEFGVDHTVHDFKHAEWDQKKAHYDLAKQIVPNIKVCRIYIGLFLEDSIGPWFGFDTKHGKYEVIGSASTPVSFTSLDDVGRSVARLACMDPSKIPDQLHLGGDTIPLSELVSTMEKAGAGKIETKEVDLQTYKRQTVDEETTDPSRYLRFLMGEGNINHSKGGLGNDNELVNSGEKDWVWRTVDDLAKEQQGKPWAELDWPPK